MRALTADDLEGRRPGTPGGQKTVDYLTAQFRKFGLKPGNGDNYVQQVPLVEIRADADATLSIDGGRGALLPLRQGTDMVLWTPRATATAALSQSDLVFVGYGIVAHEYHWDDYAGVDVRGKTVLVLLGDPGYGSRSPGVFKGLALSAYGRWSYKIEEAERHGAAGVLLDARSGNARFRLERGSQHLDGRTLGACLGVGSAGAPGDRGLAHGLGGPRVVLAGDARLRRARCRGGASRFQGGEHGPQGERAIAYRRAPLRLPECHCAGCPAAVTSTSTCFTARTGTVSDAIRAARC